MTVFKSEQNYNLAEFFQEAQNKLLEELENNDDEDENEQDNENTQMGNWWQNQALKQSDSVQTDKYTTRKNQVDIFNNNDHMLMKQNRLGVNQNT